MSGKQWNVVKVLSWLSLNCKAYCLMMGNEQLGKMALAEKEGEGINNGWRVQIGVRKWKNDAETPFQSEFQELLKGVLAAVNIWQDCIIYTDSLQVIQLLRDPEKAPANYYLLV
ncbi:ATP-dependent Clp protease ATP-binding subunit ClpC [Bienertia sinuspersici]